MSILIIAATEKEIESVRSRLRSLDKSLEIEYKVTGIGCMQTCYYLMEAIYKHQYKFVIQIGIAGSLDENIPIGSLCQVKSETLGDLGSEDKNGTLLDIFELGLMDKNLYPFKNGIIYNDFHLASSKILPVNGCTVNKTSGNTNNITRFKAQYPDCQIESMEGAALFYVCKQANTPFIELRSISNKVEERNRDNWDIPKALSILEDTIEEVVLRLISHN